MLELKHKTKLKPRKYQKKAVKAIFRYFKKGKKGNPLVVAPGGCGKSVIIAHFCEVANKKYKNERILVLSDTKEIVQQDYNKIKELIPDQDIGLYSAGLNCKKIRKITVAQVQSIYNKPELFACFDIIIVDEAHMISGDSKSRYRKLLDIAKVPVIGFTATPFRLGDGYIFEGDKAFFDEIVYEIKIKYLLKKGYLCKIKTKGTDEKLKTKGVKKNRGDFSITDLALKFDRAEITKRIISELSKYKDKRKTWLIFAINIEHCNHITSLLNEAGIKSIAVHSKMIRDRKFVLRDYAKGVYQCVVSVESMTTGVDVPGIDLIAMLRPTSSATLFSQMVFRGSRPSPETGKKDCILLDFAGNSRNGTLDKPIIKKSNGDGTGDPVMKRCPECDEELHAAVRVCTDCGHKFAFKHNLTTKSNDSPVISTSNWFNVKKTTYEYYCTRNGQPTLKVTYHCGLRRFRELFFIESSGWQRAIAQRWFDQHGGGTLPRTVNETLKLANLMKQTKKIYVDDSGKYDKVKRYKISKKYPKIKKAA